MNTTTIDPNDPRRAWTSRSDAVAAISAILAEADPALDGPVEETYDVDAIADETLETQGAGHLYRFVLADLEDDEFWAAVERHVR